MFDTMQQSIGKRKKNGAREAEQEIETERECVWNGKRKTKTKKNSTSRNNGMQSICDILLCTIPAARIYNEITSEPYCVTFHKIIQ